MLWNIEEETEFCKYWSKIFSPQNYYSTSALRFWHNCCARKHYECRQTNMNFDRSEKNLKKILIFLSFLQWSEWKNIEKIWNKKFVLIVFNAKLIDISNSVLKSFELVVSFEIRETIAQILKKLSMQFFCYY